MSRSLDEESSRVPIGRPREFDKSKAIDSAMLLFWRNGYEGTSISDLTETLGITRPSLYAAFGNKEQLFRTVLDRYDEGTAEFLSGSLDLPTAREVAEGLLRGAANFHTNPANPPGCLMVHGALVCSDEGDPLRRETRERRARLGESIRERLERALAEGDLACARRPRGAGALHRRSDARDGRRGCERRERKRAASDRRHGHGRLAGFEGASTASMIPRIPEEIPCPSSIDRARSFTTMRPAQDSGRLDSGVRRRLPSLRSRGSPTAKGRLSRSAGRR